MSNVRFKRSGGGALFAALLFAATVSVVPTPLPAAAGPGEDFSLAKSDNVGGEALIGENVRYTLTATGNHSSAAPLYNLSFRDVLQVGVAFVSSDPAPTEVLADVPSPGQTTVIWTNVSDLPAGSESSISLLVDTNPDFAGGTSGSGTVPVGSTITNSAQSVASLDPFAVPDYDPATGTFTTDFDGNATASHDVAVIPFRVTKTGTAELLRGVHQNGIDGGGGTIGDLYTIEIENNPDYATNNVSLVDTLHPGLEFLGCDAYYGADNSSAEEWTGSGPVATGTCPAPVQTPTSVDTGPAGETIVDWVIGNMAGGQTTNVVYQAGIPLLANAPFSAPPATAGLTQGRNLDNNTGASTGEPDSTPGVAPELLTAPEQLLDNVAAATGTFSPNGAVSTVSDTFNTEAEDIILDKSMVGALNHGSLVTTTLTINTSEYRDFNNLVVRDLLPSALCFVGTFNSDVTPGGSDWATNDCPGAGSIQSTINGVPTDAARVQEIAAGGPYGTGRFEVVWDFADADNAALSSLASDGTMTIGYTSVVREFYRGGLAQLPGEPVLAGDFVTNEAEVSGPDIVANPAVLAPDAADPDGGSDGDTASSSLENSNPTINKRVAAKAGPLANGSNATGATCGASHGAITWSEADPAAEAGFGPGDVTCFELAASFPSDATYEGTTIQDLLPPGYEYIPGSATRIDATDTLVDTTVVESPQVVTFNVAGSGEVGNNGNEFLWVIAATITDNTEGEAADINANLQKLVHNNNGGLVFQLRDATPVEWAEPQVMIAKGVADVDDGPANGADFDGSLSGGSTAVEVVGGSVVTYRVDVWNTGNADALATEIQDVIPTGIDCAQISNISNGGSCNTGRITWPVQTIPASIGGADTTPDDHTTAPLTLTYDLTVPGDVGPSETFTNTAGVATYQAATNTTDYVYYPAGNIDPANTALENTDAADDQAFIETRGIDITKLQWSGIDEAGNISRGALDSARDDATIGEIVQYQVTAVVPEGTTVNDAVIEDVIPTGMTYFTGMGLFNGTVSDLQPTLTGTPAPAGVLAESGGTVTYTFPTPYVNPDASGDDTVTITFYAIVNDVLGNVADTGGNPAETRLRNDATFDWNDSGGSPGPTQTSNVVRTDVVEPNPQIEKVHVSPAGAEVDPGGTIDYQITVTNPNDINNVSVSHDVTVVDTVPVGITPLGAGAVGVNADGQTVEPNGVWSETNRTITWTPAEVPALNSVDPDASVVIAYQATVDDPAVSSGTLTNTAALTAYTLDQDLAPTEDPNEAGARSYTADDSDSVTVPNLSVAKDIEPFNAGDAADDKATFVVGEPVEYEVTVSIPDGTVAFDATIFDELPAFLDFDSFGSIVATPTCEKFDSGTGASSGVPLVAGDVETFNPVGADGQLVAWFLGDTVAVGACEITVQYITHVNSTAVDTDDVSNAATVAWNGSDQISGDNPGALPAGYDSPGGASWTSTDGTANETFTVVEPQLEIDKDVTDATGAALANPACDTTAGNNNAGSDDADGTLTDGCDTASGEQLRYTVTVTNSGTSDAHDSVVVDTVPAGITPLDAPGGTAVATNGATVTGNSGSVGTWDDSARTITWQIAGPIAVAGTASVDYDAVVDSSENLDRGQDLTNTVEPTEYYASSAADRAQIVADNAGNDDIPTYGNGAGATRGAVTPDSATVEVHFPDLSVDKSAGPGQDVTDVRLDESFTWVITITSTDATAAAYNVEAQDILPEGWTYDVGSAIVTTPYSSSQVDPTCIPSAGVCSDPAAMNIELLTWTDLIATSAQPLNPTEQIVITFTATPQSAALTADQATGEARTGYEGGAGFAHTNNVSVIAEDSTGSSVCCDPDGPGPDIAPRYQDTDSDDVFIARADIEVAKSIAPVDADGDPINGPYWFGSFVNYTVTVTNAGPDEATGVELSDVLDPAALEFDSVVFVDQGTFDDSTNLWDVGTVANGETFTLTLRTRLVGLGSVTNIAQSAATDQYDSDSTPGNDAGAEDDQSEVTIEVVPTSLGDFIWLDLNSDGVQDGDEPGIPDVQVEITWLDPATGAPQSYTTTTGSDGSYGVPPSVGLPADTDITVTVNTAASPELAGLVQTFDRDATLDDTTTEQVSAGDTTLPGTGALADLDFDFGYAPNGTQSIGNKVWWDQNNSADATDGAGEYGLTGIDVTATWAGWDGIFGNGDDLMFIETTVDGDYLFSDIPPGDYRITVDTSDLPTGLDTQTFDQDGIATANLVEVTLAAGEERLDVDFSYTGPGSLGDTVWFDHDGDGTIDANEPGISGVTVNATWDGPDGIAGNADDVVLTTTTDLNGNYSFDNLPYGQYDVTVDTATLPGGMAQTFDDDGLGTANTSTAVIDAANLSNVDQDFGYNASGSIGDIVFFDVDGTEDDGVPDAGDAVLPNIDVTIVWAGADGIFGNADDFSSTQTTDASGNYLLDGLPQGDYTVTVDTATLPTGLNASTYDADGTGTADTSAVTLDAANPDNLDQDFAYTGASSGQIGDRVWFDQNLDGIQDPGEVGFDGVEVTLVWFGPDGIAGNADDVTQTTTTTGDGDYLFDNLPEGDFSVTVDPASLPAGLNQTFDADGTATANTSLVTLSPTSPSNLDQDFGYAGAGSIGDTVWFDIDNSGTAAADAGEPGIAGVDVIIVWTNPQGPDATFTATTDADGMYLVPNLPEGSYTVTVDTATLPGGMTQTFDVDGLGSPDSSAVVLDTANPDNLDQDFSYTGVGSLGDTIWFDQNNDGAPDPAGSGTFDGQDQALSGVDVTVTWGGFDGIVGDDPLTTGVDEAADDVVYPATTDANGEWLVPNLPHGTYEVTVDLATLAPGITVETYDDDGVATPSESTVVLDGVTPDNLDQDFSYTGAGSVGGPIWVDLDGDGVIGPDEVPIAGVTVQVSYPGPNGTVITTTAVTGADGTYLVEHLPFDVPITVTVDTATLPAGLQETFDDDGIATAHTSEVTLTPADPDQLDQAFGYNGAGSIGDTVWIDRDNSGTATVDGGEVGIPNVTVTVVWTNPSGAGDLTITTTTDANGNYLIEGLPHGDYSVTIDPATLPAGVTPTFDADGVATVGTTTTTLDAGSPDDLDQDFSYTGSGSVGDTVWYDENGDGVVDASETLLENVEVTLSYTDPVSGATFTETVLTGPNGEYSFDNLPAGDYEVSVDPTTLPEGYGPTADVDGIETPNTASVPLGDGETRVDVDFGYRPYADLALAKTHTEDFIVGGEGTWQLTLTNQGPAPAMAPVQVVDTLPAGVTYVSATGTDWACEALGQVVTCTYVDGTGDPADMAALATASIDLTVEVSNSAAAGVTNNATASSPTVDQIPENNDASDAVAPPLSVLGVDKSLAGGLTKGQDATYTIVATNYGPSPTRGDVVVSDALPAGLSFRSATTNIAGASCTHASGTVTCINPNAMAAGSSWTITLAVNVSKTAPNQIVNNATVSGGNIVNGVPLDPATLAEVYNELTDPNSPTSTTLGIVVAPTTTDAVSSAVATPPTLALTGANSMRTWMLGVMLLLAGAGLVALSSRRRKLATIES